MFSIRGNGKGKVKYKSVFKVSYKVYKEGLAYNSCQRCLIPADLYIYIYQLHFTYSTYFVIVLEGTFTYSCYHNLQEFLIRFQIDPAWTLSTFLMGVDSVWRSRGFEKSNSLIGFSCQRCIIGDCLQRLCTRSSMTLYLPSVIFCLKLFKAI